MSDPFSLENKTILVTGSSSGIGESIAVQCAREGAKVIVTGRNLERMEAVFNSLPGEGHQKIAADLISADERNALVDSIPVLDGVVLNSGVFPGLVPFNLVDDQVFASTLNNNFLSPVALLKRIVARKKLTNSGSVVFITGMAALLSPTASAAYVGSKGAANSASRSIAADLARRKIRVNNVALGYVSTKLTESTMSQETMAMTPLGVARPEEVVGPVLFLLSAASSWMTRSTLVVDGGLSLKIPYRF